MISFFFLYQWGMVWFYEQQPADRKRFPISDNMLELDTR